MKITAEMLEERGACAGDIKAFRKRCPSGCEVTRENCRIAFIGLDMNVEWAANELLSDKVLIEYRKARDRACIKFDKTIDAALAKCEEMDVAAWEDAGYRLTRHGAGVVYHFALIEAFYQAAK